MGNVSPPRDVPGHIAVPDYVSAGKVNTPTGFQIQDAESLERLRMASQIAAEVLLRTAEHAAVGRTTEELDVVAHQAYIELGAYPSTLHYNGYTKSICTSVNGVICHGIPDDRPLQNGDIVNIDVTAYAHSMHGDTSVTVGVGDVDDATLALVQTTREATLRGIAAIRVGQPLQLIAEAIEPFAQSRGFEVVREYGGHGIGQTFHSAPFVHHCIDRADSTIVRPGTTLTVEPMLFSGRSSYHQAADGWTEHIDDGLVSAQFEHTVVATEDGPEILTVTAAGESAAGTLELLADNVS